MAKDRHLQIISQLRKDARKTFTGIANALGIPVSTAFDRMAFCEREYIKKYVALIDYSRLGYNYRVCFIVKGNSANRDDLASFFRTNLNVNNAYCVNNPFTFLAECIFRDAEQAFYFMVELEKLGATDRKMLPMIQEYKKEGFMAGEMQ